MKKLNKIDVNLNLLNNKKWIVINKLLLKINDFGTFSQTIKPYLKESQIIFSVKDEITISKSARELQFTKII
jgi:hypothetical protein